MSETRILVFSEVFPPRHGGSGRWMWELYRRLSGRDGFAVSVLAGPAAGDAEFDAATALPISRLPRRFPTWGLVHPAGPLAYARASLRLVRKISVTRADVVHCGKCLPEGLVGLIAGIWTRRPFWCYAHGEELTLAATIRELRWLTRLVLMRAHRVVANSDHTRQLLIDLFGVPSGKVLVLHPGVDTTHFVPVPIDEGVRAQLGWSGRRVILTVGALQKRKGQDMLIRALPAIRRDVPDVLYAVAGEGWEQEYLERLAEEMGVSDLVAFHGTPADAELVQLYQQCDLFALPNRQVGSDFEGFGIVLLEAQACGKPVIAGRSGGTSEALLPGRTGELVPCDEPERLAAACVGLLNDPARRQAAGICAREWVAEHFAWEKLAHSGEQMLKPTRVEGSSR